MTKYFKLVAILAVGVVIGACFPSVNDALGMPDAGAQVFAAYEYELEKPVRDANGFVDTSATIIAMNQRGQNRWRVVAAVQGYQGQTTHFLMERQR